MCRLAYPSVPNILLVWIKTLLYLRTLAPNLLTRLLITYQKQPPEWQTVWISRSTADVFKVITYRIIGSFIMWSITLDIPKAFDKVWHRVLLDTLTSYCISGRVYTILKSFLSSRFINCQSSGAHVTKAGGLRPHSSVLLSFWFLSMICLETISFSNKHLFKHNSL